MFYSIGLFVWLFHLHCAVAQVISVAPLSAIQGDPIMVTVDVSNKPVIQFDAMPVDMFRYKGKWQGFIAIDLAKKPGTYKVHVDFKNGSSTDRTVIVALRKKLEAPLGIPASLGGNTPEAQKKLVSNLVVENASLQSIPTASTIYWSQPFIFPIQKPVVTDAYGYNRTTGQYTIAHKGTDFHAEDGTPVVAMNDGVVRLAQTYTVYGNTIVIDHGLGLSTFYMHLSDMKVKPGEIVKQGELIGHSGHTGYAEGPHLHLTVRIDNISIDPMKFMAFFK